MGFFRSFGPGDLVDIAAASFIFYRIILSVKSPVAFRVFAGLALAFAAFFVAEVAGLRTLSWLVDGLLSSLLVVLAVIFQTDIRRALLFFGRGRTLSESARSELHDLVGQIAVAAGSLSSKKIGALIVIERAIRIDSFIEVGTLIDAKVTSELLTSIFLPYSPIHDGAVIIRAGKLTMAGCFLPLTRNPMIDKGLGTRHRAAFGITEVSDAAVVVVSEESGSVSVVVGGKITSSLDPVMLGQLLQRLLEEEGPAGA